MRLLLVEDDALLSGRLRGELQRAGFAVDVADNGVDAGFLGESEPYDMVVLDIGLPGRLAGRAARLARGRQPDAGADPDRPRRLARKVDGFKAGADDYLSKPFHTAELIARLQALLRRGIARPPGLLQAAGLELDENAQTVRMTASDATVELTGTEFRLLRYLMLHPGGCCRKAGWSSMSTISTPSATAMCWRSTSTDCAANLAAT